MVAVTEGGGNYTAVTLWGHLDHHWYLTGLRSFFQFERCKGSAWQFKNSIRKYQAGL